MSLFVVYVPETGHVVGAVNTNGGTPPADVESLVGDALPVRVALGGGDVATILLPSGDLELHSPDDEPGVLTDPMAYGVELVGGDPQPVLERLLPWSDELDFTATGLLVTLPVAMTRNTPVLAWVSEGQDIQVIPWEIEAGKKDVTIPVTVGDGPHGVLVLVAGWVGRLEEVSAP